MMLMLGETILQIVIAPGTISSEDEIQRYLAEGASFVIAVCMMYSFNVIEPHEADHHAMRRSAVAGLVYLMLFSVKACSVLQVGVAIKLALYAPTASPVEHYAATFRFYLALSLVFCFGLVFFMRPLHEGFVRFYDPSSFTQYPLRLLLLLCSLVLLGGFVGLAALDVQPYLLLVLEAILCVMQVAVLSALLRIEKHALSPRPGASTKDKAADEGALQSAQDGRGVALFSVRLTPESRRLDLISASIKGMPSLRFRGASSKIEQPASKQHPVGARRRRSSVARVDYQSTRSRVASTALGFDTYEDALVYAPQQLSGAIETTVANSNP